MLFTVVFKNLKIFRNKLKYRQYPHTENYKGLLRKFMKKNQWEGILRCQLSVNYYYYYYYFYI